MGFSNIHFAVLFAYLIEKSFQLYMVNGRRLLSQRVTCVLSRSFIIPIDGVIVLWKLQAIGEVEYTMLNI